MVSVALLMQGVLLLLLAPLLTGFIRKVKALMQGRKGPRLLQPYYDLNKFMRKEAVISENASWLTLVTPYIVFGATVSASLLFPFFGREAGLTGNLLLFLYLLALGRFFTALTALDAGSAFGGMGASREMFLNVFVEPALLIAVLAVTAFSGWGKVAGGAGNISFILTAIALFMVLIAETGRIPVDNPDTHLELTMIHEGMLLEYSGRYLGLMEYSGMLKQMILLSFFASLFLPIQVASTLEPINIMVELAILPLKVFFLGFILAVVETRFAKLRLFQIPVLYLTTIMLGIIAIVLHLVV